MNGVGYSAGHKIIHPSAKRRRAVLLNDS